MGKKHCSRCGKKTEGKKYNPYNETFEHFWFMSDKWDGGGHYCLTCAEIFVKERNKCKGGHWIKDKDEEVCPNCGNVIDPETCHCGGLISRHNSMNDGHNPVPMGCTCGYDKEKEQEHYC